MQPLDLLKVKFQVDNQPRKVALNPLRQIYDGLVDIKRVYGYKGWYRGINANITGNAASWGLYFWL